MGPDFEGIVNVASDGDTTIRLDGRVAQVRIGSLGRAGALSIQDTGNRGGITLHGENGITLGGGPGQTRITLNPSSGGVVIGGETRPGQLELRAVRGGPRAVTTIELDVNGESADLVLGARGQRGRLVLNDDNGNTTIQLTGGNGDLVLGGGGVNGDLFMRRSDDSNSIHLRGDVGDIVLENADCAEEFDCVTDNIEPGDVVVLTDRGAVRRSADAFDKRVVGIASGAGAYQPGIVLDRRRVGTTRRMPVAIAGKAFCKVNAATCPVGLGDLLTTSSIPGHAMKADDPVRAFGAVIGKALAPLEQGVGLVPVLVGLQ
jgi:hypothetical protein